MTSKRKRIQFELQPRLVTLMDQLVRETGADNRAEMLRRMLRLYSFFVCECKAGKRLALIAEDGNCRDVVLPEAVTPTLRDREPKDGGRRYASARAMQVSRPHSDIEGRREYEWWEEQLRDLEDIQ